MTLPNCETLLLEQAGGVLHVTLNRPDSRNAMSLAMVEELRTVLAAVRTVPDVRALVLRGAGGHFCAGGDIKDMASARATGGDAYRSLNRAFGSLLEEAQAQPQALVVVLEGAVLGGGFGLACVSDIAIAHVGAQFGLPETSLGVLPAQIAPFVVKRIGLTQARRLALTAARFDGFDALRLGLVHFAEADTAGVEQRLAESLEQVRRCAPAPTPGPRPCCWPPKTSHWPPCWTTPPNSSPRPSPAPKVPRAPWPSCRSASPPGRSEPLLPLLPGKG